MKPERRGRTLAEWEALKHVSPSPAKPTKPAADKWAIVRTRIIRAAGLNPDGYTVAILHDRPLSGWRDGVWRRSQPVVTVVALSEKAGSRVFLGVARCAAGDTFSRAKGRAIALGRAVALVPKPKAVRP